MTFDLSDYWGTRDLLRLRITTDPSGHLVSAQRRGREVSPRGLEWLRRHEGRSIQHAHEDFLEAR